jgi:hypothetical protein
VAEDFSLLFSPFSSLSSLLSFILRREERREKRREEERKRGREEERKREEKDFQAYLIIPCAGNSYSLSSSSPSLIDLYTIRLLDELFPTWRRRWRMKEMHGTKREMALGMEGEMARREARAMREEM